MEKLGIFNKIISIVFVICILFSIWLVIEPLLYNSKARSKVLDFDDENIDIINTCFYKYETNMLANKTKNLDSYYPLLRKKSHKIYSQTSEYLNNLTGGNYSSINIGKITKVGNNKYKIGYNINFQNDDLVLIIKINKNRKTFNVLYDSLIH